MQLNFQSVKFIWKVRPEIKPDMVVFLTIMKFSLSINVFCVVVEIKSAKIKRVGTQPGMPAENIFDQIKNYDHKAFRIFFL